MRRRRRRRNWSRKYLTADEADGRGRKAAARPTFVILPHSRYPRYPRYPRNPWSKFWWNGQPRMDANKHEWKCSERVAWSTVIPEIRVHWRSFAVFLSRPQLAWQEKMSCRGRAVRRKGNNEHPTPMNPTSQTNTVKLHRVLRAKPERIYRAFLDA